jgi:NAD(P)H-hydrate epimerase
MLSIAVPESLKLLVVSQLPEALVIGCPEPPNGAITALNLDLTRYDAIALGPGLTTERGAIVEPVLRSAQPLLLDADGLNSYAQLDPTARKRDAPTILTPHPGEFARLFPDLRECDRWTAVQRAAECSGAIVLLKGAITLIAAPDGSVSAIANGTPALARGGSGDVLTGFVAGLLPQSAPDHFLATVATGAYFHAQAAQQLVTKRTELGVDPVQLAGAIAPTIAPTQTER